MLFEPGDGGNMSECSEKFGPESTNLFQIFLDFDILFDNMAFDLLGAS